MHEFDNFGSFGDLSSEEYRRLFPSENKPTPEQAASTPSDEPELIDLAKVAPQFAADLAQFKVMSDRWVEHQVVESTRQSLEEPVNVNNSPKNALDLWLVVFSTLREQGYPISIDGDATYGEDIALPDHARVRVESSQRSSLNKIKSSLRDKFTTPILSIGDVSDRVPNIPPSSTPHTRMAAIIGSSTYRNLSHKALILGSEEATYTRQFFPELDDQTYGATLSRVYMSARIAEHLESSSQINKNDYIFQRSTKPKLDLYEKLAERGIKPISIEQFHGIVSGAVRTTIEDNPELRAA